MICQEKEITPTAGNGYQENQTWSFATSVNVPPNAMTLELDTNGKALKEDTENRN